MRILNSFVCFKDSKKNSKVCGLLAACGIDTIAEDQLKQADISRLVLLTDDSEVFEKYPELLLSRERALFLPETEYTVMIGNAVVDKFNHVLIMQTEDPKLFPADRVIALVNAMRLDGLGILDHVNHGAILRQFELSNSEQRGWFRQELTRYIESFMPALPRPSPIYVQYATEIQDELLMNAIWDASPARAHQSRKDVVYLAPDETVRVNWAFDGFKFAISVRDRFGSFPPELCGKYMRSLFSEDKTASLNRETQGAGIGLFMILTRASEVTINVAYRKYTEVVVVLDFSQGPKNMAKGTKNFQFFNLGGHM